jgi:uncharacterized protein (TIGR02246 family)
MSEDEAAVRELVDTWMRASMAGDLTTVLDLMSEDVVFMTPGRPPFGKKEFAADAQGMQKMQLQGSAEIRECQLMGDWAYLRNYLSMTMTPEGGAPVAMSGWTLTVLRKEADGKWRLARDANFVMPDKAAG